MPLCASELTDYAESSYLEATVTDSSNCDAFCASPRDSVVHAPKLVPIYKRTPTCMSWCPSAERPVHVSLCEEEWEDTTGVPVASPLRSNASDIASDLVIERADAVEESELGSRAPELHNRVNELEQELLDALVSKSELLCELAMKERELIQKTPLCGFKAQLWKTPQISILKRTMHSSASMSVLHRSSSQLRTPSPIRRFPLCAPFSPLRAPRLQLN